jgi:hypothetical protein
MDRGDPLRCLGYTSQKKKSFRGTTMPDVLKRSEAQFIVGGFLESS